jgi:hypothetical protein
MLGLLTLGYYLNYIAKHRLRAGKTVGFVLGLEALCFLLVSLVQVTVNLLHLRPERWESVAGNAAAALADPTFAPRWLHFVLAAVTVAGVLLALAGARRGPAGTEMARFGVRAALVATMLQLLDGFWLLFALPGDVLERFVGAGVMTVVPLVLGTLGGTLLFVLLTRSDEPATQPQRLRWVVLLLLASTLLMVVTRHQVRDAYLAPARAGEPLLVSPQWGVFALFVLCFGLCVGLTVWLVARAWRDRPAAGEPAA